jgi:hypothetical protein
MYRYYAHIWAIFTSNERDAIVISMCPTLSTNVDYKGKG